jgi:2'-5' RNA ligase
METRLEKGTQLLWEYLLVAPPDAYVYNKIMHVKQDFFNSYKQPVAIETNQHITIANFLATEAMEETAIRWIHRVCSQYRSFPVTLNNYSGLPSHTIYVRVQDEAPFKQLAAQLKVIDQYVRSNGCPPAKLIYRPHLTIARGLDDNVYNKAMFDYSQQTFHESFFLTELILLKRCNQFDACKQVNVFRFYPPDTNMYDEVAQQLKHQPI